MKINPDFKEFSTIKILVHYITLFKNIIIFEIVARVNSSEVIQDLPIVHCVYLVSARTE